MKILNKKLAFSILLYALTLHALAVSAADYEAVGKNIGGNFALLDNGYKNIEGKSFLIKDSNFGSFQCITNANLVDNNTIEIDNVTGFSSPIVKGNSLSGITNNVVNINKLNSSNCQVLETTWLDTNINDNKVNVTNSDFGFQMKGFATTEADIVNNYLCVENVKADDSLWLNTTDFGNAIGNVFEGKNIETQGVFGAVARYAKNEDKAIVKDNRVILNDVKLDGVFGAYNFNGKILNNSTIIENSSIKQIYGASSQYVAPTVINTLGLVDHFQLGYVIADGNSLEVRDTKDVSYISGAEASNIGDITNTNVIIENVTGDSASVYGGKTMAGNVNNNRVEVTNSKINSIVGGYTGFFISPGLSFDSLIDIQKQSVSSNNTVVLKNSTVDFTSVVGGTSPFGTATSNVVTLENNEGLINVIGGYAGCDIYSTNINGVMVNDTYNGLSNNNKVIINSGVYSGEVNGGKAVGKANDNIVEINGGNLDGLSVKGGSATDVAANNVVMINGGSIGDVSGAVSDRQSINNRVIINKGEINGTVCGGYIPYNIDILFSDGIYNVKDKDEIDERISENNKVIINDGIVNGAVYGGAGNEKSFNNTLDINGGKFVEPLVGGTAYVASYDNVVNLNDGDYEKVQFIAGGMLNKQILVSYIPDMKTVEGNVINVNGGNYGDTYIFGGYIYNFTSLTLDGVDGPAKIEFSKPITDSQLIKNNVVNINTCINGGNLHIYGGAINNMEADVRKARNAMQTNLVFEGIYSEPSIIVPDVTKPELAEPIIIKPNMNNLHISNQTNNTLNVYSSDNVVNEIAGFQNLNFYMPETVKNGTTIINVVGGKETDISNAKVKAGVKTGAALYRGDKINLITNNKGINTEGVEYGKLIQGISLEYDLNIEGEERIGDSLYKKVVATITNGDVSENAKSPVETQAANMSMLNIGADLLADKGLKNAIKAIQNNNKHGGSPREMTPFVGVGANKSKVKSGSHVDVNSWGSNLGFAKEVSNKKGTLMFGPIVEYGYGSYDSYLDNGTHGEGNSKYWGVGGIAMQRNTDGIYYEGSLKFGKSLSSFKSHSVPSSYDMNNIYFSMHAGLGKVVQLDKTNEIDYYGKMFYTHQSGNDVYLTSGENYDFSSTNSTRIKLGTRLNHNINENNAVYAGLGWQYEFSGISKATIHNGGASYSAPAPSLKGNTGFFELGWKTAPEKARYEVDLGLDAYTGKQTGVGMSVKFNWKF